MGSSEITLQQSGKNGLFRYIFQQHCLPDQFQFVFEKKRRWSRQPESPIKTEQLGGYSILQLKRRGEAQPGEVKVFVFLNKAGADLDLYKRIPIACDLNIYEPYFENCRYAYILEFFTNAQLAESLLQELAHRGNDKEVAIYEESQLQLS